MNLKEELDACKGYRRTIAGLKSDLARVRRERDGLNIEVEKRDEIIDRVINQHDVLKQLVRVVVEELRAGQPLSNHLLGKVMLDAADRLEGVTNGIFF